MKYPHWVKHNDKYYAPGEEIPEGGHELPSEEPQKAEQKKEPVKREDPLPRRKSKVVTYRGRTLEYAH